MPKQVTATRPCRFCNGLDFELKTADMRRFDDADSLHLHFVVVMCTQCKHTEFFQRSMIEVEDLLKGLPPVQQP